MSEPNVYLYSVGIDEYTHVRSLRSCVSDAEMITELFSLKSPGASVSTLGMLGQGVSLSEVSAVLTGIQQLRLTTSDHLFFYFAGHGFSADGQDFLVCSDTDPEKPKTALPTQEVLAALSASGAGTAIFIVDACRNLVARDIGVFIRQTIELARREGVIVFSSCSPGEVSQELPEELGHGVFTYAFYETIVSGGMTTPIEIDGEVIDRVEAICKEHKLRTQRPYTSLSPLQKASVDIFTGKVRGLAEKPRRCILVLGPSNAGKTRLGEFLNTKHGFLHVEMSSFAWNRFRNRDAAYEGSLQSYLEEVVWPSAGPDILARDLLSSQVTTDQVVVCGARRIEEVECLRAEQWDVLTIFLYANARIRFQRWIDSGEASQSASYNDFVLKDFREYSWGLAEAANLRNVTLMLNEQKWQKLEARTETLVGEFVNKAKRR